MKVKNASDADAYYASVTADYGRIRDEGRENHATQKKKVK